MFRRSSIVNQPKVAPKIPLKTLVAENFTAENGKFFYSLEVTPSFNLDLDLTDLKTLPLFIDVTWTYDENLNYPSLQDCPALEARRLIESTQAVNSITCYKLTEEHVDQLLDDVEKIKNFTVLRGGE